MKVIFSKNETKNEIISSAKQLGAIFVVVYLDHYRGNSTGNYMSLDTFINNYNLQWSEEPDDRLALSVIITDEDVPGMIEKRRLALSQMERVNLEFRYKKLPELPKIDMRLSKTNPLRIEYDKISSEREEILKNASLIREQQQNEILEQLNQLKYSSRLNFIS